ncbi:MAG: Bro-N domain-containing protein [Geobacteraceae bacterium]|nr:Bro-N domain-containing protein [Geobacteraceae bacterium]
MTENEIAKVAVFEGKHIRKILHGGEWWFSVIDIVQVLTGSSIPKRYWSDLKRKLAKEGYSELYENIVQLKFAAADGKFYATDCANTETMSRIIQSIPSPKVEPLKRWLARVGRERIDEIDYKGTRKGGHPRGVPLRIQIVGAPLAGALVMPCNDHEI